MAYTVNSYQILEGVPLPKTQVEVSGLVAGNAEDVAHYGPDGVRARSIQMEVLTRPTDGSDVRLWHDHDNDSLTNNTCRLVFSCEAGGSLTGAVVRLIFIFGAMASGGITPP